MDIATGFHGKFRTAVITGEIDGKTAPAAQEALLPLIGEQKALILDMNGVTYMSSAGLRMLFTLNRQAAAGGVKIAITGLSDQIKDVMQMTGFLKFFTVRGSLDEAAGTLEGR
jgi:anti-sigma B factor antagonist